MSDGIAEAMHHQTIRTYRRELARESKPLRRAKLVTLIARAMTDAKDHGWPATGGRTPLSVRRFQRRGV